MASTFSGIELGKRSMQAHSQSLQTIGHNISNASTEGYSRQRVQLSASQALYEPQLNRAERPGQIGQGVDVASIGRIKDDLLQNRVIAQGDEAAYWETRDNNLLMVEQIYNEPYDTSVRNLMDQFWDGWQELSVHPDDMPARQQVLKRGESLIDGINSRYTRLKESRTMMDDSVKVSVGEVNGLLKNISALNEQIVKSKALKDNPNDLLDKRDLLVEKLSSYMSITVDNRDADEFQIHTKGRHLIQGKQVSLLELKENPLNEGYSDVVWAGSSEKVDVTTGKLGAYLELRDDDIRGEIQNLDTMTMNFTDMVNQVHKEAISANGQSGLDFFTELAFVNNTKGNYDLSGDGTADHSYIFRMTGGNPLNKEQQFGLSGTLTLNGKTGDVDVPYYPSDRVEDLIERINNSSSEVKALLDRNGRFTLKGSSSDGLENPDFVIRHVEDSGQFLRGYAGLLKDSGPEGAYDWAQADSVDFLDENRSTYAVAPLAHPAGWLQVNSKIKADPTAIASGFGQRDGSPFPGDGSAALELASLRQKPVMLGDAPTFDDYFAQSVAEIGLKGEVAQESHESHLLVMKDLKDMQQSISGVNMDEEMANMIKFQSGFNAAAKFISEMNQMLDTIINRMGV